MEGCIVGIFDIDAEGAVETGRLVTEGGGTAHPQTVDIGDYRAVEEAVADFESKAGPTDILVNNAGWDQPFNFLDTEPDFWDKVIRINLHGPLNMHHVVVRGMAERGSGRVVNIASDAGRVGSSGEAVYSACKGGIIAFTKTLARELARRNVTLNTVCPGPTETPLFAAFTDDPEAGAKIAEGLKRAIPKIGRAHV